MPSRAQVVTVASLLAILVALAVYIGVRDSRSPRAVVDALHGAKAAYVGSWESVDRNLPADLSIDADGELSYSESSRLRASRGEVGDFDAQQVQIRAFEGDDIVVDSTLQIRVTSAPHAAGGRVEMTANGIVFARPGP
ncbi:MAG: hypothetical protein U0324_26245 [Polyangiales bacterium]